MRRAIWEGHVGDGVHMLEMAWPEKWLASQPVGTTFKGFKGSSVSFVATPYFV